MDTIKRVDGGLTTIIGGRRRGRIPNKAANGDEKNAFGFHGSDFAQEKTEGTEGWNFILCYLRILLFSSLFLEIRDLGRADGKVRLIRT
jgi:hypothetical protein